MKKRTFCILTSFLFSIGCDTFDTNKDAIKKIAGDAAEEVVEDVIDNY